MKTIKSKKQNSASKTLFTTSEIKGRITEIVVVAEIEDVFNNQIN